MRVALERVPQEHGQQAVVVTVEGDGRHDAGNWSPALDLSIEHRDGDDDSWVGLATVPCQPGITYVQIDDLKAYVRCVSPTWISDAPGSPPEDEGDSQD